MIQLKVNQKKYEVDVSPDMPLLWVIRDVIGLTGTKYGCGIEQCGACIIDLNDEAIRSCITLVSKATGKIITTIEGLSADNNHPLQLAWIEADTPQCGYFQSGLIMSAAALLKGKPNLTDGDIDDVMSGNICRCGTYPRLRKAIHTAAELQKQGGGK